jgi:hypothetical protein
MGWRPHYDGVKYFTIEDRIGTPIDVGPLLSREGFGLTMRLQIYADITEFYEPGPDAPGPRAAPSEVQRAFLKLLLVRDLDLRIVQVESFDDLRDENGQYGALSDQDLQLIQNALHQPTKGEVNWAQSGRPAVLLDSDEVRSEFLDSYFEFLPMPLAQTNTSIWTLDLSNMKLDLAPGVYELQFRLTLMERDHRDVEHKTSASLRFWVWDPPSIDELRVIEGYDTQRMIHGLDYERQRQESFQMIMGTDEPPSQQVGWAQNTFDQAAAYERGIGVTQDDAQAFRLYSESCLNGGHTMACTALGVFYETGRGVTADLSHAIALYEWGCNAGNALACHHLGNMYLFGKGVAQDYERARKLMRLSCDQGEAEGCANLGYIYGAGQGVEVNYSRAVALYRKACDMKSAHACRNLGIMYESGFGVDRDLIQARQLFAQSCAMGDTEGCQDQGRLQ